MASKATDIGPIVVDANVLFGALLRDSTNRNLILHGQFDLHAPAWLWDELERNRSHLIKKSRVSEATFDLLLDGLKDHVRSISLETIRAHLPIALDRVGKKNEFDAPYVAAAMAIDGGVWSHDRDLGERAGVPVFTTGDLVRALDG